MIERSSVRASGDDEQNHVLAGKKKLPQSTAAWIRNPHPGDLDDPGRRPQFDEDDSELGG